MKVAPQLTLLGQAVGGAYDWEGSDTDAAYGVGDAAIQHGVDALLWQTLADARGPNAAAIRAALEPRVRAAVTRDLFVKRDLERVLDALAGAGVAAIVIKGTALAYTSYPQPWLRPRTDSDLLVRHGDLPAATRTLQSCGYTRSAALSTGELVSHQIAFERTDANGVDHVLDVHWKIVNPQVVADALTFDDLWRHAQPAPALGHAARVPSTVASIALGCIHRLAHHQGHDRLIWLYDIDLLASRLQPADWDLLRDSACEQQIAGFCLDGLRAARECFGTHIPQEVEATFEQAAPNEPSRAYVDGPVTRRDVLLSDLAVLGTWRERARLVREHAFPSPDFMQQRYGPNTRWPLAVLYLRRILTGASRWVRS